MPRVYVAFVRFEVETCAKKIYDFAVLWSCFLEIVEGRATLFAPKAIHKRILQLKRESTQKFTKKRKKMWKDEGGKEKKRSKRKNKREEEK